MKIIIFIKREDKENRIIDVIYTNVREVFETDDLFCILYFDDEQEIFQLAQYSSYDVKGFQIEKMGGRN